MMRMLLGRPCRELPQAALLLLLAVVAQWPARAQDIVVVGDVTQGSSDPVTSPWVVPGELAVGRSANGSLTLTDGARVQGQSVALGYGVGSFGAVTVSGPDSYLNSLNDLTVGYEGDGLLTIERQASARSSAGALGMFFDSKGTAVVRGRGTFWNSGNQLDVGWAGHGTLHIEDGAEVYSQTGYVAFMQDSSGEVNLQGRDTRWNFNDALFVGAGGKAGMTISGGAAVQSLSSHAGFIRLAQEDVSEGTLAIGAMPGQTAQAAGFVNVRDLTFGDGAATLVFNHDSPDYAFSAALASVGTGGHVIRHLHGDTTLRADSRAFTGTTQVEGGVLRVAGALGGQVRVASGGSLGGGGTVGSVTVEDGGALTPGHSIGTLSIDGSLTMAQGARLDVELGRPSAAANPAAGIADRIAVRDDLRLEGTLNLRQSGDPGDGQAGLGYYRLLTYGGALSGSGLVLGSTPDLGADYAILAGNQRVDLFVGAVGDDQLQHWQGGDGVWGDDTLQWRNRDGELPVAWAGNHAVFRHAPGGFQGGDIDVVGTQRVAGLQFVDAGYRLQGAGRLDAASGGLEIRVLADQADVATHIDGDGGITKTGAGRLVLSGANTYQGGTTIRDGVLSVTHDANLGDAQGALAFDGGILQISSADFNDTDRRVDWGAAGGGFDIVDPTNRFYLDQRLEGQGDLVKRGDGVLILAGDNHYGNTRVEGGVLLGSARSLSGDIANAGEVVFLQDTDDRFKGDITGLGGARGAMRKQGQATLRLEGRSLLDWAIADGTLSTDASRFFGDVSLDGAGSTLLFTDAGQVAYDGVLSGNGIFRLDGAGTVLLRGDSAGFDGRTVIAGGTLLVGDAQGNGALGGSMQVHAGATLGGSGTVGTGNGDIVTVGAGAVLAPGNSIGTLTIDGDLVLQPGARLAVQVDPSSADSDRVQVTGDAALDGAVAHVGAAGDYALRASYRILSANGRLTGAFDTVMSDFAFLAPTLSYDYDAGTVDLALTRNDRDFAAMALTRNQIATAHGIERIGPDAAHPVYDVVAQLPDDAGIVRAGFDALSGEIHASAMSAWIEDSRVVRDVANRRLLDRQRTYGPDGGAMQMAVTPSVAGQGGSGAWSHVFGSWGKTDGDGNAASLTRRQRGLLIGADRDAGNWRLGVLGGYSRAEVNARDRHASARSDGYHLGLYGGTQWGGIGLRTGVAYTRHAIDTRRNVAVPGLADNPRGRYHAGAWQAFGELGAAVVRDALRVEPFVSLAHVGLRTDGYREHGGDAALSGLRTRTDVTFTTVGVRAEHAWLAGGAATLRGMLGWRRAFGDTTPGASHGFHGGQAFTIEGAPIARDMAVIEAGLDWQLAPGATLGVSYSGQWSGRARDHGARAALAIRF